jgi:hypothetical protein
MSNKPIKIQLHLPAGDSGGSFITAGRKVKIHSVGMLGGTGVASSGSEYTTQREGIIELTADWRGHDITQVYVYDEKGKRTEYALKSKVYVPKDGSGPVKVELRKS